MRDIAIKNKWGILGIFFSLTLLTCMGQFITGPLAPFLMTEVGLSKTQLGVLASAPYWGNMTLSILWGLIADKFGEKIVMLIGPFIMALGLYGFSVSPTYVFLILSSYIMGAGFSTITVLTNRGISYWFGHQQRSFAIGIKQSGMPIGVAAGAAILPALALNYSWQTASKLTSLVILLGGVLCFLLYHEKAVTKEANPYRSFSKGPRPANPLILIFKLIFKPEILLTGLLGMSFLTTQTIITTFTIPYLQETVASSPIIAGFYLALIQLSGGFSRPFFGLLGDLAFNGRRQFTLITLAILTAFMTFILSLINPSFPDWLLAITVFITGFMAFGWFGPYFATLSEIAGPEKSGLANGIGVTLNCIGVSVGTPIYGFVVDFTGSYAVGFQVFSFWLVFTAFIFILSVRKRVKPKSSLTQAL